MRQRLSLWLTCLVTTWFLPGSGESVAQEKGQAPPPVIAPFDAAQAKVHQKVWADHLGVPVESTNSIGMKMVLIPPGKFTMGSPESEAGRNDNETQRRMTTASSFSLGVHEVTQSQFEAVMGNNPSRFNVENYPVERVSWDVAVVFCEKLSALPEEVAAGRVYRLPTEKEWEYACRAGSTTEYSFGDDKKNLGRYAWFNGNSRRTTQAVGKKLPNDWGLYDMHGNVSEWCSNVKGSNRVDRGGGWSHDAVDCRAAVRRSYGPTFRSISNGFRVAQSSPEAEQPFAGQAPPPAVAPFDAAQAKVHQTAWADHLDVPVESANSIGMKMVLIPPGEFMMGSPEFESERRENEAQRTVTIASPFSLGVHEVTQSQYEQVMGSNPSEFKDANYPVERVSWDDAVAFCRALSALPAEKFDGRVYRLPTEAEWEYACRAGMTTEYSFGDDKKDLGKYAWFHENSGSTTHAVGEKLPNGWGLSDMHGNLWEWCSDTVGSTRVLRGGGWDYFAANCRTAYRGTNVPSARTNFNGFRLALSSPSVESPEAEQDK